MGDPCVVCALYEIFSALNISSADARREAVAPTSLRVALSNLYPDSNFFQEVTYLLCNFDRSSFSMVLNHEINFSFWKNLIEIFAICRPR